MIINYLLLGGILVGSYVNGYAGAKFSPLLSLKNNRPTTRCMNTTLLFKGSRILMSARF